MTYRRQLFARGRRHGRTLHAGSAHIVASLKAGIRANFEPEPRGWRDLLETGLSKISRARTPTPKRLRAAQRAPRWWQPKGIRQGGTARRAKATSRKTRRRMARASRRANR